MGTMGDICALYEKASSASTVILELSRTPVKIKRVDVVAFYDGAPHHSRGLWALEEALIIACLNTHRAPEPARGWRARIIRLLGFTRGSAMDECRPYELPDAAALSCVDAAARS